MKTTFNLKEVETENLIEKKLNELGWKTIYSNSIYRKNYIEVIDENKLKKALIRINLIDEEIAISVINKIRNISDELINMNKQCHEYLTDGIKIYDKKENRTQTLFLIDEKNIENNQFELVRQLEVSNTERIRKPDIVLYINGLPIIVMELKSPTSNETLKNAFYQNETLKTFSPELFKFNLMIFLSNHIKSKFGSLTASFKKYCILKTKENNFLEILFQKEKIINILFNYTFFQIQNNKKIKILSFLHQIEAVEKSLDKLQKIKDSKGGIVWHTQGSGKSITMIFLTKKIIKIFFTPTILLVTDRKSLDKQLFDNFNKSEKFLRNKIVSIQSREDLIDKLNNKVEFGIYFTTIQKFVEKTKLLSKRDDIFVLIDEGHRTQNVEDDKLISEERKTIEDKYAYAKCLKIAFPNAKTIAFTGTPLIGDDRDSRKIFGDYNHVYSMKDSEEDGMTVPILYEVRKTELKLNKEALEKLDFIQKEYIKELNPKDIFTEFKKKSILNSVTNQLVLEDPDVITVKLKDILKHYKKRKNILNGKAMIVVNSRNAAYIYYKKLNEIDPELGKKTILVITGTNKDKVELTKARVRDEDLHKVETEFRKDTSKYKIVIVVNKWLTGFDVQDLDVMYMDRLIRMHNLMQAIARVNRVYENQELKLVKKSGLIVDYIGIWSELSKALLKYAAGAKGLDSKNIEFQHVQKAKEKVEELFDILEDFYINGIKKFYKLNESEKYEFVIEKTENIRNKSTLERNKFYKIFKDLNHLYKISYTVLFKKTIENIKGVLLIKNLVFKWLVSKDEKLILTITKIKEWVQKTIESEKTEINLKGLKMIKNITKTAQILENEAKQLMNKNPRIAIDFLYQSLEMRLNKLAQTKPIFSKKTSEKLKEIINKLEEQLKISEIQKMLIAISKDITNKEKEPVEFKDTRLQSFFEIVANDKFLKHHNNSEVFREIAKKLSKVIEDGMTDQFHINPKIRDKILFNLMKLLKNEYNYPPEGVQEPTGLIVDVIEREIRIKGPIEKK